MSLTPHTYITIHQTIQQWYVLHGRHALPWRTTNDPYKIYISEMMLQQTQVATVLERYYFPFLKRFPTLKSLVDTPIDDVLKMWDGLGYYRRARYIHQSAQLTQGVLPSTIDDLIKLPGIGQSTAHAVGCFGFDLQVPILDANVKRILYRFFALKEANEKLLWQKAYQLFDKHHSFNYNQALMDIGSLVCTHKNPKCTQCPLQTACLGQHNPMCYPTKKPKAKKPIKDEILYIATHNQHFSLHQRHGAFLSGLWGFYQPSNLVINDPHFIGEVKQTYTHFTQIYKVYTVNTHNIHNLIPLKEIKHYTLSGIDKKILNLLKEQI
jgi:A/G-specific adenine glycosylase